MRVLPVVTCTLAFVALACSSNHSTTTTGTGGDGASSGSSGSSGTQGTGGSIFGTTTGTGAGGSIVSTDGGPSYPIYADTDTDLYTLDPSDPTLTLTHVGAFDCIGPSGSPNQQSTAMTDVAVDMAQNIWALSSYGVRQVTVQGSTVHCGKEIYVRVTDPNCGQPTDPGCETDFPYIKFEALTFAPVGTISMTQEVLVAGDTAGELWTIDTDTDAITQHGIFGTVPADDGRGHSYPAGNVGKPFELSGDMVFLANNGKPVGFATVRDCPNPPDNSGCDPIDTLIEIDMDAIVQAGTQNVRKGILGQVVRPTGGCSDSSAGYGSMYGIASWNAVAYGFSRSGQLVSVSNVDGSACLVKDYAPLLFSGAAVTTIAPVIAPPPPPVM
jgi:hypothetical protein